MRPDLTELQDPLPEWQNNCMADDLGNLLKAVGPRLRAVRQQRSVTLADLSSSTGISVSTLSRLESGQRRPTLEHLLQLATAYGVPLDEMVGAPPVGDPRVHPHPISFDGKTLIPLSRQTDGVQAFKLIIPRASLESAPDLKTHEGYEWIYVLSGRLRMLVGQHDLVLKPGEAAEFDTRVPHWFGSADNDPVEVLSLFGPQGERAHFRVRPKEQERTSR
jgi:transcriptional regulator with XRE-family HTH domain